MGCEFGQFKEWDYESGLECVKVIEEAIFDIKIGEDDFPDE